MRRLALLALMLVPVSPAAPATAAARAKVEVLVVGKRAVLAGPRRVALAPRSVRVAGERCSIGRATPLSALAGAGVAFSVTDYGACSRRPRDAGSLYVRKVGPDRAHGDDGWVYKVGRRAGSAGAADPAGSFGTGRLLRGGQRVLWFWCVKDAGDSCQRTLAVVPATRSIVAGGLLRVRVRGYDDAGHGIPVEGALVRLGDATALSGADGSATLTAPAAGRHRLRAERAGMVVSFPVRVKVS
jgi:hypothetical protein